MPINSLPLSRRLRSIQHILRDARLGEPMSPMAFNRLERLVADAAGDAETMELAAGQADVTVQLKAAGNNPVMMRAVLRQHDARKAGRHGR